MVTFFENLIFPIKELLIVLKKFSRFIAFACILLDCFEKLLILESILNEFIFIELIFHFLNFFITAVENLFEFVQFL